MDRQHFFPNDPYRSLEDCRADEPLYLEEPVTRSVPCVDFDSANFGLDSIPKLYKSLDISGGYQPHEFCDDSFTKMGYEDTSDMVHEARVPPFALCGYLEPYYHVFSHFAPKAIMSTLKDALAHFSNNTSDPDRALCIDTVANMDKFKLQCTAYSPNQACKIQFIVRIFSLENLTNVFAVEFQRRSGDTWIFSDIYSSVVSILSEKNMLDTSRGEVKLPNRLKTLPLPPPPPRDDDTVKVNTTKTINSFLQMASSPYLDMRVQAVETLCGFASERTIHDTLISCSNVLMTLLDAFRSNHDDLQRCSLSAFAHIVTYGSVDTCEKVLNLGVIDPVLEHCQHNKEPQICRETARFFATLLRNARESFLAHLTVSVRKRIRDLFMALTMKDSVTCKYASSVLEMLPTDL